MGLGIDAGFRDQFFPQSRLGGRESLTNPLEQKFARQAAADVDQHGPNRKPSQPSIEVDPRMNKNEEGANPSHDFMYVEQFDRLTDGDQFSLSQGIAKGKNDQQDTWNSQELADPNKISKVQGCI
jgi:hypothetical protein